MLYNVVKLYGEPHSMHRYFRKIWITWLRFCQSHNLNINILYCCKTNYVLLNHVVLWDEKKEHIRKFCIAALGFKMGMVTRQIFAVHPNPNPRRKMIDYAVHNNCATCGIKYPKDILRCSDCNHRIRTTGWHSRKEVDKKRIWF